jgi:tripartite-type tricarboxylate transporter receptor subunit TctC
MFRSTHNSTLKIVAILLIGLLGATGAFAQGWPTKPVKLVVPFPPGGGTDILARILAEKLTESLGQPVVVDNRPGASGNIGTGQVAKAAPDGYTLLLDTGGTLAINPNLYTKLPFDPAKDFAPITQVAGAPYMLAVHPSVPAKSVAELIAYAKANPNQLSFASSGNGQPPHVAGELFMLKAGVLLVHVPYKGAGPAIQDTVAGHTSLMFASTSSALEYAKAGRLRPLAITSVTRHPLLPDLPTMQEAGLAGYEVTEWFAMLAPAGTPPEIVARLHREVVRIVTNPEMKERLTNQGFQVIANTPEAFAAAWRSDIAKWGMVVKEAKLQVDFQQ